MTGGGETKPILRFGVAGLGAAFGFLAQSIVGRPHLRFVAGADPRAPARTQFEADFGGKAYEDVAAMCRDPDVDVVYIMTPNRLHCAQAVEAAEAGKHVIVDKPMALTLAECDAMIEAAERNGVTLMCGHPHSFDPSIRAMRALIAGGDLGALRMIHTWNYNDWIYRPRAEWELQPEGGGNLLFNQGPHQVDLVRLLGGGMVRSVRAQTGAWDPNRPIVGAYTAFLEFDDGVVATLVYSSYAHFDIAELTDWVGEVDRTPESNLQTRRRLAELQRTEGEATFKEAWRYGGAVGSAKLLDLPIYGFTVVSCDHGDIRQIPSGLIVYGDEKKLEIPVVAENNASNAALENMHDVIFAGAPVLRSGRWGKATIEVLLAIIESAETRREVDVHHQVPSAE